MFLLLKSHRRAGIASVFAAVPVALGVWIGTLRADDPPAAADAAPAIPAESPATTETPPVTDAASTPAPPPRPIPIDQQPYRVLVAVGIAPDPALDARFREQVLTGLRTRINSRLGPLWEAEVSAPDWLSPGRMQVLEQFTPATLIERFSADELDKVFLATIEPDGSALRLAAREWDINSQTITAVTSLPVYEPRVVVDSLLAELVSHFRPIAAVEETADGGFSAELRLRGGELLPPDPELHPVAIGDYLQPYARHLDRKKELRLLQPIHWSYLRVDNVDRGRLQVSIHSAFRSVLGGSRRRTEMMAIAVKPRFAESRLRIVPRGQSDNPLSGVRVDVLDRQPTPTDPVDDRVTLYTDRVGEVTLPTDPAQPLRFVYVTSGHSVLAVVPFIPGEVPSVVVEVPDDTSRLAVEGEIAILEAELIEIVARREVTIARILGHARASEWEQADRLVNDLKNLPNRETLKERLDRIRLPAVAAARQQKNRTAESRIVQMCQQLVASIEQHLDPDRINTLLIEVRELKEAS